MSTISSTSSSATTTSTSSSDRLTGMISSLDTDSLVKSMVSGQQTKIDKQEQKKTTYEWYEDAVNGVVSDVEDFSNTYLSVLGSSSILKASAYSAFTVTSDSTANEATITAGSSADTGNITLSISQLAVNANISSSAKVSKDGTEISSSNTATLGSLSLANDLEFNASGNVSFSINGSKFTFSSSTTLQSMINTINNDDTAGVTMKYSRLTDTFTVTADSGGKDSSVSIVNLSGNAFGSNSAFGIAAQTVKNGKNALATINGTAVEKDSNNFTIDGITYNLNKVTSSDVTYTIASDYSSTVDTISKFVDAYNTLITKLTTLDNAKDYSADYPPLTEAQEETMTDDQITAWNEKAKSGILNSNKDLESLISSLRSSFLTAVGGTGDTAASIGITGGSYYSTDKGLLVLDEDVLTEALQSDPQKVISMFTSGSSSSASADMGIAYRVKAAVSAYTNTAADAITTTDTKISNVEDTIDTLNDKLDEMSDRYYEKFSVMETALSKLESQSSYISQLFSS